MVLRSSWADPDGNVRKARNLEQAGVVGDAGTDVIADKTLKALLRVEHRRPGGEEGRGGERHERMARGTGFTARTDS
jgi:hypothetical protein